MDSVAAETLSRFRLLGFGVVMNFPMMMDFYNIKTWVTFVGYGRSGHSFIGSALDAHPEICITHEADSIRRSVLMKDREELFASMFEHDRAVYEEGRKTDNRWGSPYSQRIEGQFKQDPSALKVMGNKNASIETQFDRDGFDRRMAEFQRFLGDEIAIKLIAVLRNPFDAGLLKEENYSILQYISEVYGDRLHLLKHESFIQDPRSEMIRLVSFLGLENTESHLEAVVKSAMPEVHRARYKIGYSEEDRSRIQCYIDKYPIFDGYSFDS